MWFQAIDQHISLFRHHVLSVIQQEFSELVHFGQIILAAVISLKKR